MSDLFGAMPTKEAQMAMFDVAESGGLRGKISHVRFRNPDNGYTVAEMELESGKCETVVGALPEEAITGALTITLKGDWTTHVRYGRQYSIEGVEIERPATVDGVTAFLGSGLIPNIGPARAADIAQHFGANTLDILDEDPQRIAEVKGIGGKIAVQIAEAWAEHKAVRNLIMLLGQYDITTNMAMRIYAEYGAMAEEVITTDPYKLMWDMDRVGFKTADELALKMGGTRDNPQRIAAALYYVYSQRTQQEGHCYLLRDDLISDARNLLGVPEEQIEAALESTIEAKRMMAEQDGIYSKALATAERITAERIQALLVAEDRFTCKANDGDVIDAIQEAMDITLTQKQMQAVFAGLRKRVSVITGGPGTGKTTIIKAILAALPGSVSVAMMAPTGRAAKRMTEATGREASTIHRGCDYNPQLGWGANQDAPLWQDMVIVDEVSMLDISVARHLFEAIADGSHVILVGDIDQLPSVGPGNVLRDIIASAAVTVTHLDVIHRQAETSTIITGSHAVNQGAVPLFARRPGEGDVFFFNAETQEDARDLVLDLVTSRIPRTFDVDPADVQVLGPIKKGAAGVVELNKRLQGLLNPDGDEAQVGNTIWRVGDRVMQTKNNYEAGVFNGDLGIVDIVEREGGGNVVWVRFDDQHVKYSTKDTNDNLLHAWAMTIHKSQGSEFPVVVIPLMTAHYVMLQRNLIYTAMTRARQTVVIVGQKRALHMAVGNAKVARRNTALADRIKALHGVDDPIWLVR